ncbi:helix-turn-helix domain-containing protein [Streptomyces scopuliridis]|uniref:helix-turn-helix domain-containing protein n=1 Tax=Streptomyces scopuliridis TaxID=452529 RepID=UPI00341F0B88
MRQGRISTSNTSTADNGEGRRRLLQGTLSQELIIKAAFRVADSSGMEKLTFDALGRELSAHPTAIYRHFRNKDELLLALIGDLHEEALSNTPPPTDDWAHDLIHDSDPGAGVLSLPREGAARPRWSCRCRCVSCPNSR